jgi:hypothetical protein
LGVFFLWSELRDTRQPGQQLIVCKLSTPVSIYLKPHFTRKLKVLKVLAAAWRSGMPKFGITSLFLEATKAI